jgi:hypothetical protein
MTEWVSEPFEKTDGEYVFRSALTLPKDKFDALTDTQKEDLKTEIFNSWLSVVKEVQ